MFRFYKNMLKLKTRLQEQNLKKHLYFFYYPLNLFICCKTELKIKFIFYRMRLFYRMNFFAEWIFSTELNFLKGDTNIYFKQIPLFEKKRILLKSYIFFSWKYIIFFNLVLLQLNNQILKPNCCGCNMFWSVKYLYKRLYFTRSRIFEIQPRTEIGR